MLRRVFPISFASASSSSSGRLLGSQRHQLLRHSYTRGMADIKKIIAKGAMPRKFMMMRVEGLIDGDADDV